MSELLSQSETTQTTAETVPTTTASSSPSDSFLASLAEDVKHDPSLQSFKDINSLAKSYVSAQKMIGSRIPIPGEDASEDIRNEFFSKLKSIPGVVKAPNPEDLEDLRSFHKGLGCPDKVEDYKLSIPDTLKDIADSAEVRDAIKLAHTLGANTKQVQHIVDSKIESIVASRQEEVKELEAAKKALTNVWGQEYDNRMKQAIAASQILNEKFPEEMKSLLSGPARNNPALLSMLSDLGSNLKEKGHVGMTTVTYGGLSADEARGKIREVMSNPGHAYFNPNDPSHKAEVAKVLTYYNIADSARGNS